MKTDMKEIAEATRKELKDKYPAYKFSVTVEHYSGGRSMTIAMMSGPASPFACEYTCPSQVWPEDFYPQAKNAQLNDKYIEERTLWGSPCHPMNEQEIWVSNGTILTQEAAQILKGVVEIANKENYDNSDIQTDYFDVNFYFHLNIGKWNKDFEVK
jgi:hypothetical protein